ncbi:MAG: hypothetical protein SGJ18_07630 [Pseudomonadota bacterium]|nr:hypothetical protein [Pseudomonadota bacterium]
MKNQFTVRLKKIAELKSKPFCYSCYTEAPSGRCVQCGSDDLMRLLPSVGCEYGFNWVIADILSEIENIDAEEFFEDSIRSCYEEETKIGWIKVNTATAIKELDPVSWDLAKSEWFDLEESEDRIISFDSGATYYDPDQLESEISKMEADLKIYDIA